MRHFIEHRFYLYKQVYQSSNVVLQDQTLLAYTFRRIRSPKELPNEIQKNPARDKVKYNETSIQNLSLSPGLLPLGVGANSVSYLDRCPCIRIYFRQNICMHWDNGCQKQKILWPYPVNVLASNIRTQKQRCMVNVSW